MPQKKKAAKPSSANADQPQRGERLQKVLAAAGVGSRRECEQLILDGRVEVDREIVTELGSRVDAERQEIRVDGSTLTQPRKLYYAVNKPPGVVCTNRDPAGRMRVVDLINSDERLFTIGRLDRSSEGLILVTNDGELANRLTHPRFGIEKTYRVRVAGHPDLTLLKKLEAGMHLADGFARVASARIKRRFRDATELQIVLDEGRNREIRRLLARVGHKVLQLKRVALGPLKLDDMPVGAYRKLSPQEVKRLRASSSKPTTGKPPERRAKPRASATATGPATRGARKPANRQRRPQPTTGTVLDFESGDGATKSATSGGKQARPAKKGKTKRRARQPK